MDPKDLTDAQLDARLAELRQRKEELQADLRRHVAEFDRRATLRDIQGRYPKLAQQITGAGGIPSQEQVGKKD